MTFSHGGNSQKAKVALVTGASRGLGAEIAETMAEAGWAVAVNYATDEAAASQVVERIKARKQIARPFRFDVRNGDAQRTGLAAIRDQLGPVDVIVNNATGPQPELALDQQTWQHYTDQMEFALRAPFELLQWMLPDWRARGGGAVINIGSEAAELGSANAGHYVAAKGAMLAATRSWAKELAKDNIRINLVAPGWIPVERHDDWSEDRKKRYTDLVPFGRFGVPRDVANAVVFLASDNAGFITGQRIAVNGGRVFL